VNPTRLFVLSALARRGAMYGHQIRRDARVDRAELWSDVRPGSLYGALHRLEGEGLVQALRTEREGNLPARTVYEITAEGRRELHALQAEAFEEVRFRPDPVDLALATASDLDESTLRGHLDDRRQVLAARLSRLDHLHDRTWPDQTVADDLVAEHARLRLRAELEWHEMVLDQLGKLTEATATGEAGQ
jgi:DNA-binding PadR family transcriptional regulator